MSSISLLTKARIATSLVFLGNGIISANWIARIPSIKERLLLTPGQLGLSLFGMPIGLLIGASITPILVSRFGDRNVMVGSTLLYCLMLPFLGFVPNNLFLFFVFLAMGITAGILDVSMNIQAAAVEKEYQRPIMSSFHGLFSLGGLIGAVIAGIIISFTIAVAQHLLFIGFCVSLLVLATYSFFLPKAEGEKGPLFVKPNKSLFALGIIAFCVLLGEGAIGDWAGVYLRDFLKSDLSFAAYAYGVFSLCMAIGRFTGDGLVARFGRVQLTRLGGAVSLLGIILSLLSQNPFLAVAGFGFIGLGFAAIFPNVITAASNNKSMPQSFAIASVTTLGYFGFLVGPPLIGLGAELLTLRISLGLLAVLSIVVIFLSNAVT